MLFWGAILQLLEIKILSLGIMTTLLVATIGCLSQIIREISMEICFLEIGEFNWIRIN